jgi:peptidoglycan/LPS O-acetylase OafA/YrhL
LAQYPALTSLRFLAALLVFLFHFPPQGAFWDVVAVEGHVGVNIFFVLSGFLITLRYAGTVARGEMRFGEYFLRRVARILPLYYAVFFLSLALTKADAPSFSALLPELTLTQALFGETIDQLVIPTSWSLTVEECFYALAPLLFLAVAAARRRRPEAPLRAAALVLVATTVVLFAVGALIWTLLDGRGPGFVREPYHVVVHTLFGRFYDFALGAFAALAFAAPSGERLRTFLARPMAGLFATLLAAAGIVVAQWGMHEAGGIESVHWVRMWRWDVLLAPAAALLILSLTAERNPIVRALGREPFVYLGKVSYALYLVQSTPLGKGLLYRVLPHHGYLTLAALYVGMTLMSAAFYELVEEPARKLILRLAGLEKPERAAAPARASSRGVRLATAGVLAFSLAAQCATWAVSSLSRSLGPVTLEELRAAGLRETDHISVSAGDARWGRDVLLVGVPRRWREGWGNDLRAPSGLHVFLEGKPIPFSRREPPGEHVAAFFRGPRAEHLALRVTGVPDELIVARECPIVMTRVHTARLVAAPRETAAVVALFGIVLALGFFGLRTLAPRTSILVALALLLVWTVLELYGETWAIALVVAECAAVAGLAAGATSGRLPPLPARLPLARVRS